MGNDALKTVKPFPIKDDALPREPFRRLVAIMRRLRAPIGGCPWDLEQNHVTLKTYLLEEAYEVLDAIGRGDSEDLKEELGDLLLQIVFHAQIADDEGRFTIDDVAGSISEKMVRRHPHVFGGADAPDSDTVLKNWDEIKKAEKAGKGKQEGSALDGVPKILPALFENYKISKKAAKLGFDWKRPADVFEKIAEETRETRRAIRSGRRDRIEEELGDLLFAVANLCRAYKINPELALNRANAKFRARFRRIENLADREGKKLKELDFKSWNRLWEDAKKSG